MAVDPRQRYQKFQRPDEGLEARQLEETESHINRIWQALNAMESGHAAKINQVNSKVMAMSAAPAPSVSLDYNEIAARVLPITDAHYLTWFLKLDCSNAPLTGSLSQSLVSSAQTYLDGPALYSDYTDPSADTRLIFSLWDPNDEAGCIFRFGFWKPPRVDPPSMAAYYQFIAQSASEVSPEFRLSIVDPDTMEVWGRISIQSADTYIDNAGVFHAAGGYFTGTVNVQVDAASAIVVGAGSGQNNLDLSAFTDSWNQFGSINLHGYYVSWDISEYYWFGDSTETDGLSLASGVFGLYQSGFASIYGHGGDLDFSGNVTFISENEDSPPFNLSANNTGVLVAGLNADLLDGYEATAFEPALGNPAADGYVLSSTAAGVRSWIDIPMPDLGSGTDNYIPKFGTGATPTFGDSIMSQSGTNVNTEGDFTLHADALGENRTLTIQGWDGVDTKSWKFSCNSAGSLTLYGDTTPWGYLAETSSYIGYQAGKNATGANNMCFGYRCMEGTAGFASGSSNAAIGAQAMFLFKSANQGVAVGHRAAYSADSCYNFVAVGMEALRGMVAPAGNTAVGYQAGYAPANVSANALTSGANCTFIGFQTGYASTTQRKRATALGYQAIVDADDAVALGNINASVIIGGSIPATKLHVLKTDAVTNAVTNVVTVGHNTSGTAAAGFGGGILGQLQSSTTADQDAAQIAWSWTDATHATRNSKYTLYLENNGEAALREILAVYFGGGTGSHLDLKSADGTATMSMFLNTASYARLEATKNIEVRPGSGLYLYPGRADSVVGCGFNGNGYMYFCDLTNSQQRFRIYADGTVYQGPLAANQVSNPYYRMYGYNSNTSTFTRHMWRVYTDGWLEYDLSHTAGVGIRIDGGKWVFNEAGGDYDLRIEGDTATNLLVCDAGLDAVQIGTTVAGSIADFRSSSVVINESGSDCDMRIEGDTDDKLFFLDASADKVGISTNAPTVLFSVKELSGVTEEGGFAIKLTAGEDLVRGNGAYINPAGAASTVYKTPVDGDMCIGVVYADATSTNPVWVIVSGKAYVLPTSTVSFALGDVIYSSTTEAGRADSSATVPAITTHMREWGHALAASGSNGALTLCVLHFN